jgi:hypothetical protein
LLDYSSILATHFVAKGYELYGKKDTRFLEAVYRLLLQEFTYKPQLTRNQFFNMGYAERKLIFVFDIIQLIKQLHKNLNREIGKKEIVSKKPNHNEKKDRMVQARTNVSDSGAEKDKFENVTGDSSSPKNSFGFKQNMNQQGFSPDYGLAPRPFSPEYALASLWQKSNLGIFWNSDIKGHKQKVLFIMNMIRTIMSMEKNHLQKMDSHILSQILSLY